MIANVLKSFVNTEVLVLRKNMPFGGGRVFFDILRKLPLKSQTVKSVNYFLINVSYVHIKNAFKIPK